MDRSLTLEPIVVGNVNPWLVIQKDTRQCFSACILSILGPEKIAELGIDEEDISRAFIEAGIANSGGLGLESAEAFDSVLKQFGLEVTKVYGGWGLNDRNISLVKQRLNAIEEALLDDKNVVIAFPKLRDLPLISVQHYAVVSGYEDTPEGRFVTIMDPSDVDGRIERVSWDEFKKYVTPAEGFAVMAWGVSPRGADKVDTEIPIEMSPRDLSEDPLDAPGIELLDHPYYLKKDTGKAIPSGTLDPVSVAMPTTAVMNQWAVRGAPIIEGPEGEFSFTYPRFGIQGDIKRVSLKVMGSIGWLPFPTRQAAEDSLFLARTRQPDDLIGMEIVERQGAYWIHNTPFTEKAWQNCGLGMSTRNVRGMYHGIENDLDARSLAENEIRADIVRHTGARAEDIYFFPTGMAAIHEINRVLVEVFEGAPSVQFGFPYTDTWDIQKLYGRALSYTDNVTDLRDGSIERLRTLLGSGINLRSLFLEWPSNPLLAVPDLDQIGTMMGGHAPIVLDDTVGTMYNLNNRILPDGVGIVVRGITKFYSPRGNVMGGAVTLRPENPHYERIKAALERRYEDQWWFQDAQVMAKNGRDFDEVMPAINSNSERLAGYLYENYFGKGRPLRNIYYPSITDKELYDRHKTAHGGYGGLMTLRFSNPTTANRFYDALEVTKGPSLGTFYTLACQYTKLAHKDVMNFIMQFGVLEHLVRLSVGIEDPAELESRVDMAMTYGRSRKMTYA